MSKGCSKCQAQDSPNKVLWGTRTLESSKHRKQVLAVALEISIELNSRGRSKEAPESMVSE